MADGASETVLQLFRAINDDDKLVRPAVLPSHLSENEGWKGR